MQLLIGIGIAIFVIIVATVMQQLWPQKPREEEEEFVLPHNDHLDKVPGGIDIELDIANSNI